MNANVQKKKVYVSGVLSMMIMLLSLCVWMGSGFVSKADTTPNYLTFTAEQANSTVALGWEGGSDFEIRRNGGAWEPYIKNSIIHLTGKGDRVSFRGQGIHTTFDMTENKHFIMTGKISASGSVTSLTDGNGGDENVKLGTECYSFMFADCASLVSAPSLPALNLSRGCYMAMFDECTGLTAAPQLPSTVMKEDCYREMFNGCTSIKSAPVLPATELADGCYLSMFRSCSNLQSAPVLPATTLKSTCYNQMFKYCRKLTEAPELPARTLAYNCYNGMFEGCTSLEYIPDLPATTLAEFCYTAMFSGCSGLKISQKPTEKSWKIAAYNSDSIKISGGTREMFENCPGVDLDGNGGKVPTPNTTYYYGKDDNGNYLTFTAAEDNSSVTFKWASGSDVEIRKNDGNWETYTAGTTIQLDTVGDKVQFKGNNVKTNVSNHFTMSGSINASGSVTSLTDGKGDDPDVRLGNDCYNSMFKDCSSMIITPNLPALNLAEACYFEMFIGCTGIVEAPELPATVLADSCYGSMFSGCTNLSAAPLKLPAMIVKSASYSSMFKNCISLINPPKLPATELAYACYADMFYGCTNLENTPELPATTLTANCYTSMFNKCIKLKNAPDLPSNTLADSCYNSMFSGCSGLMNPPELQATVLKQRCYADMFSGCTSLKYAPSLPATSLANLCYDYMFYGCTSLKISQTKTLTTWSIAAYESTAVSAGGSMFGSSHTGIDLDGKGGKIPTANTTYYQGEPIPDDGNYLTFTALEDGSTLKFSWQSGSNVQIKIGNGTWENYEKNSTIRLAVVGDKVSFKGKNVITDYSSNHFQMTGKISASGSVTSLTDESGRDPEVILDSDCYNGMFNDCSSLLSAPKLPAVSLSDGCYAVMFRNCTNLKTAPALPATALADGCYYQMFEGCAGLKTAPDLPATEMKKGAYGYMFCDCTSIQSPPELPAVKLAEECYNSMFRGCTALRSTPSLPADKLDIQCYTSMFSECTGLISVSELPARYLAFNCYGGMFSKCTNLISAPSLPATSLEGWCYQGMFSGCTSLQTAPALPAKQMEFQCYKAMFYGCTSLKKAPALPAVKLAEECYARMFRNCTSLQTAPELPATELADTCYWEMFYGCTGLENISDLPADVLKDNCYALMFYRCSSLKRIPNLTATVLANGCYGNMFSECTGLKISKKKTDTKWVIKSFDRSLIFNDMFADCPGIDFDGLGSRTPVAGITYYQGDPIMHTVTFYAPAADFISTVKVYDGEKVNRPTDPIRKGYNFKGWYMDSAGDAWDFDKNVITSDITLYAIWESYNDPRDPSHKHIFTDIWTYDMEMHWKECIFADSSRSEEDQHRFGDYDKCVICGYKKGDPPGGGDVRGGVVSINETRDVSARLKLKAALVGQEIKKYVVTDKSMASVNSKGVVTFKGKNAGDVAVKAQYRNPYTKSFEDIPGAVIIFQLRVPVMVKSITIAPGMSLSAPDIISGISDLPAPGWTSSRSDVAAVDEKGNISIPEGAKAGSAKITATFGDSGKAKFSTTIKVKVPKMSKAKATVKIGQNALKLKLNNLLAKADSESVMWESSDPGILSVSSAGEVKAISDGSAVITALYKDKPYTCQVTVSTPAISKTAVTINAGKSVKLSVKNVVAKNAGIRWSSSNESKATVDSNGKVTVSPTAQPGDNVEIIASVGGKDYSCRVTVK